MSGSLQPFFSSAHPEALQARVPALQLRLKTTASSLLHSTTRARVSLWLAAKL